MNYRIIIMVIGGIVIMGVIVVVLFFLRPSQPALQAPSSSSQDMNQTLSAVDLSPVDPAAIPAGATIQLGTPQGTMTVNNFYKTAQGYDGEALVLHRTAQYEIVYGSDTGEFGIYIMTGPVDQAKKTAENDLSAILGVTPQEMCKLSATEVVSQNADPASRQAATPLSSCSSRVF